MCPLSLEELKEMERSLPDRKYLEAKTMDKVEEVKQVVIDKTDVKGEQRALKLFEMVKGYLKMKKDVNIDDITKKFGSTKPTIYSKFKKLVEMDLLEVTQVKGKNYYSLVGSEPVKTEPPKVEPKIPKVVKTGPNGYDNIIKALPISKPKNNVGAVKVEMTTNEFDDIAEAIRKDTIKEIKGNEPVIAMGPMGYFGTPTVEDRIVNLVGTAYKDAESIQINPGTNEIHIKMKG